MDQTAVGLDRQLMNTPRVHTTLINSIFNTKLRESHEQKHREMRPRSDFVRKVLLDYAEL
jgi:hypothetical protein